jgi:xyloglucan-specific exo-beta-1,4-glucanase
MSGSMLVRLSAVAFAALFALTAACAADDVASQYVWKSVKVGGGGYIPGLIFSPAEKGLAYLRSDMGGIYRWDDRAKVWVPTQDGNTDPNYRGIESIAPDPVDPNVVYAAVGTYRAFPAAILRSNNRGDHWEVIPVPFRMGGNEEGRDLGERLAVDPNDTSILYFGSRYDGLQRSADKGKTWAKVASFPLPGLGVPDGHARPYAGVSFVVFDPTSGAKDSASKTIFAGVADPGEHHLFRSDDAGKTWAPVPNEPPASLLPGQAQIDAKGVLTITYANSMGPWAVNDGAVYKLNTKLNTWTNISPDKGGFMGLSLDRQHDGTLVVATIGGNSGPDTVYRSTDGGAHWQSLREISQRDVSSVPFLYWGEKEAEFGWWISGLAIDPFDSSHLGYTTGATVFGTNNLLESESGKTVNWTPWVEGVEQTAVITLSSPAKGVPLISGFGDIGGFVHEDLTVSPPITSNPMFTNTNTIDYADKAPNVIVRSGTHSKHNRPTSYTLAYSTDFGKTWTGLKAPLPAGYIEIPQDKIGYNYGDPYIDASIIVSADGKSFVVMTPEPVVTADRGKTWTPITGLPAHHGWLVADRADANRFYALDYDTGTLFVSTDGARSFKAEKTAGLPEGLRSIEPARREAINPLLATPGKKGDLWFMGSQSLYHSTDGGKHFEAVNGGIVVRHMDFGKAAPNAKDMTLFAIGTQGDTTAIFRSLDNGKSWQRVNDGAHEYHRAFRRVAADKNLFGRVYIATDGRGIVFGEPIK